MMTHKRVIGYARVSSREQAEDQQALEQQIARLKAAGATEIFQEVQSGKRDDRRKLNELIKLVELQQIDGVIATRIDRIARSLPKLREVVDVFKQSEVNLVLLDQSFDLSTSQGKLMMNLLGSLAEWEVDLLSERVKHGKEHRRKLGKACEQAPWGYLAEDGKYVLDHAPYLCLIAEDRPKNYQLLQGEDIAHEQHPGRTVAQLAREFVDTFLQEKTVRRTLKTLFAKYGVGKTRAKINSHDKVFSWTERGFNLWLRNPVLCGHTSYLKEDKNFHLKHPSEWLTLPNTHPENILINNDEAAEIKYLMRINYDVGSGSLGKKSTENNRYREYAYQAGRIFCAECGFKCTIKYTSGKNQQYSYYGCRHSGTHCRKSPVIKRQNIEASLIQKLVEKSRELTLASADESDQCFLPDQRLSLFKEKLRKLEELGYEDPDLEKVKQKLRQQIEATVESSNFDYYTQRTAREIISAGNNLAFWHTLSNDEKFLLFPRLFERIFIRNGEVESIIFTDEVNS